MPGTAATVARGELEQRLADALGRASLLVVAGAGFGKTTALEAAVQRSRLVLGERDMVDADVFLAATERALQAPAASCRGQLERAAERWAGDPLPEERYADWAAVFRERLIDRYADVLSALADACEAQLPLAPATRGEPERDPY